MGRENLKTVRTVMEINVEVRCVRGIP